MVRLIRCRRRTRRRDPHCVMAGASVSEAHYAMFRGDFRPGSLKLPTSDRRLRTPFFYAIPLDHRRPGLRLQAGLFTRTRPGHLRGPRGRVGRLQPTCHRSCTRSSHCSPQHRRRLYAGIAGFSQYVPNEVIVTIMFSLDRGPRLGYCPKAAGPSPNQP